MTSYDVIRERFLDLEMYIIQLMTRYHCLALKKTAWSKEFLLKYERKFYDLQTKNDATPKFMSSVRIIWCDYESAMNLFDLPFWCRHPVWTFWYWNSSHWGTDDCQGIIYCCSQTVATLVNWSRRYFWSLLKSKTATIIDFAVNFRMTSCGKNILVHYKMST